MMGAYGSWGWYALGLVLIVIELIVAPGSFLLWIGIAAGLLGLIQSWHPLGWTTELVLFALLSLATVSVGVFVQRRRGAPRSELNERTAGLVGQVLPLDEATGDGAGRVRVGDTVWRVSGPAMAKGSRVQITGVEGSTLLVEPAEPERPK